MSLLSDLNATLEPVGIPLETGVFSDAAPDQYIVLVPLGDSFDLHADNAPGVDVQEALDFLVEAGFLTCVSTNTYEQTDMAISGASDAIPKAIRSMHKHMAILAANMIDSLPKSERNVSGLTIAANKHTYERVVNELNICRKKIASIVTNAEDANRIYRVNLQMFPVTKEITDES